MEVVVSRKNSQNKGDSVLPLILAWLFIAVIAFVLFMTVLVAILWFVEWLPANFGLVGVLLFACVVCYIFYKYA